MALSKKAKLGIAAVAALALFGFGSAAAADDVVFDPPDPDPPEPPDPENPLEDPPDTPLPPPPPQCNYSGCGPKFDGAHAAPTYYALRIQQLGYPIDVATVAANNSTIAVQPQRGYVAHFQRHFNTVRANTAGFPPITAAKLAPLKSVAVLGRDGLIGERTILAITLAHNAVNATGIKWEDLVKIGGGPD